MRRPLGLLILALLAITGLGAQIALQLAGLPLPSRAAVLFNLALLDLVLWAGFKGAGPNGATEPLPIKAASWVLRPPDREERRRVVLLSQELPKCLCSKISNKA